MHVKALSDNDLNNKKSRVTIIRQPGYQNDPWLSAPFYKQGWLYLKLFYHFKITKVKPAAKSFPVVSDLVLWNQILSVHKKSK